MSFSRSEELGRNDRNWGHLVYPCWASTFSLVFVLFLNGLIKIAGLQIVYVHQIFNA